MVLVHFPMFWKEFLQRPGFAMASSHCLLPFHHWCDCTESKRFPFRNSNHTCQGERQRSSWKCQVLPSSEAWARDPSWPIGGTHSRLRNEWEMQRSKGSRGASWGQLLGAQGSLSRAGGSAAQSLGSLCSTTPVSNPFSTRFAAGFCLHSLCYFNMFN